MKYGIKGFSVDRKYATGKVIVDDANTSAIDELASLGYEFVSKEEFEAVELLGVDEPVEPEAPEAEITDADMAAAILEGVNEV